MVRKDLFVLLAAAMLVHSFFCFRTPGESLLTLEVLKFSPK